MINLLPTSNETLIVTHSWDVVLQRLEEACGPERIEAGRTPTLLIGWIKVDHFQLMLRQKRPNSFTPLVEGTIDPTSTGCLIFLKYKLMPVPRMYLTLWSIIVPLSGIFISIYYMNYLLGFASFAIIGVVYGIAWANFKLHQKPLHDAMFKLLA